MPLPPPRPGTPPHRANLPLRAYEAIRDDDTIDWQVRVAVLHDLETLASESGRIKQFEFVCEGEIIKGPSIPESDAIVAGHAMTLESFERGLTSGWFGTRRGASIARSNVESLRDALDRFGSGRESLARLEEILDRELYPKPPEMRVVWYFYDESDPRNPMKHVGRDLALRLALPGAFKSRASDTGRQEYVVFEIPASRLCDRHRMPGDPRKPRFTDTGHLTRLNYWRPGGRTSPSRPTLTPLDEMVALPVVAGGVVIGFRITECDHTQGDPMEPEYAG